VASVLTFFEDWALTMPECHELFLYFPHMSHIISFVTNWNCGLSHFDELRYAWLCGNVFLWLFKSEAPAALSVSFLSYDGFNYKNFLLSHIHHCKSNEFRPQDWKIWASRTFIHYHTSHSMFVDCMNDSLY
jgi:hypothetical protein